MKREINISSYCRKHNSSSEPNFEVAWKKAAEAFLLQNVGVKYKERDSWWLACL